jgi:hypothetical protein
MSCVFSDQCKSTRHSDSLGHYELPLRLADYRQNFIYPDGWAGHGWVDSWMIWIGRVAEVRWHIQFSRCSFFREQDVTSGRSSMALYLGLESFFLYQHLVLTSWSNILDETSRWKTLLVSFPRYGGTGLTLSKPWLCTLIIFVGLPLFVSCWLLSWSQCMHNTTLARS